MREQKLWGSLHPFVEGGDILGRGVANEGFLIALAREADFTGYHFFLRDAEQARWFTSALQQLFPDLWEGGVFLVQTRRELPAALARARYHCFHLSDCIADSLPLIRLRNACSRHIFPVTGVTHSLSYANFAPFFFNRLWQGCTRRDAIICTSSAGQQALKILFAAQQAAYGLDAAAFPSPRLERIPLGVFPGDFASPGEKSAFGAAVRKRLGIGEQELALLVFARISLYSKMDILPLLRALQRAERMGLPPGRYTLLLAGHVDSHDSMPGAYTDMAARMGIRLVIVPSPSNAERKELYAAADIFLSPVDNLQETFGLTLLEAGASSLPVVASDFDGYRDIVIHGKTGFLIPVIGPSTTTGIDALSTLLFDSDYHLLLAQESAVCVPELAARIAELAASPDLRRAFGAAAHEHVVGGYTWKQCIARHMALWEKLAREALATPPSAAHPLHPGYARVFGGYYSRLLADCGGAIRVTAYGESIYRRQDLPLVYAGIDHMVDQEALRHLLFLARKPVATEAFLAQAGAAGSPGGEEAAFLVLWALKHDMLELIV